MKGQRIRVIHLPILKSKFHITHLYDTIMGVNHVKKVRFTSFQPTFQIIYVIWNVILPKFALKIYLCKYCVTTAISQFTKEVNSQIRQLESVLLSSNYMVIMHNPCSRSKISVSKLVLILSHKNELFSKLVSSSWNAKVKVTTFDGNFSYQKTKQKAKTRYLLDIIHIHTSKWF